MCGRKTLTKGKIEIMEELFVDEWEDDFDWEPSYNIAPTQVSPVLLNDVLGVGALVGKGQNHRCQNDQCPVRNAGRKTFLSVADLSEKVHSH